MEFPLDSRPIDPSLEVDDSLPLVDRIVLCSTDKRKYLSYISLISEAVETASLSDLDRVLQVVESCVHKNTTSRDYDLLKSLAIQLPLIFTRLLILLPPDTDISTLTDPSLPLKDPRNTPVPYAITPSTTILDRIRIYIINIFHYLFLDGGAQVQSITIDAFIATVGELLRTLIPFPAHNATPVPSPAPLFIVYPVLYHELCEILWSIVTACGAPEERYIIRTAAPTLAMTMSRAIYYDNLSTIGSKGIANFLLSYCQDPLDLELHKSVAVALRLWTNPCSENILDTFLPSIVSSVSSGNHQSTGPLFHRTLSNVLGSSLLSLPSPALSPTGVTKGSAVSASSSLSSSSSFSPLEAEAQCLFYKVITGIIPPQPNEDNSPIGNTNHYPDDDDDGGGNHNHVHKINIQEAFARFSLPLLVSTNSLYFVRYFVPMCINLVQESHPTVAVAAYPLIGQLLAILAPAADICTMRLVGTPAYFVKDIFHHSRKSRLFTPGGTAIDDHIKSVLKDDTYKDYGDIALLSATFDALLQSYLALAAGNIPQFSTDVTQSLNEKTNQQVQRISSVNKVIERKRNKSLRKNHKLNETITAVKDKVPIATVKLREKREKILPPPPPVSPATEITVSFPTVDPGKVSNKSTDTEKPMLSLSGLSFLDGDEETADMDDNDETNENNSIDNDADNEDNGSHTSVLLQGRKYNKYGIRTLPSAVTNIMSDNSLDSTEDNTDVFSDSDDDDENEGEQETNGMEEIEETEPVLAMDEFTISTASTVLRPIRLRKVLSSGRTSLHDTDDYSNQYSLLSEPTLTSEDAVSSLLLDEDLEGLSPTVITDEDDEGYNSSTTNNSIDSNSDRFSTSLSIDIEDEENGEEDTNDDENYSGNNTNLYSSDLIAAEVTSYQIGDLHVRRAEAVARTLPGVVRALCAMAMDILHVCHLTRMGSLMLEGTKYHVHRHRARALLVHRVRTIIRIIHRLYRTRDSLGYITSALCTGLHEIVASLLVACRAIAHLSAHIDNHPVHNLAVTGGLGGSSSLIMESPGHRTNNSSHSNNINRTMTSETSATTHNSEESNNVPHNNDNNNIQGPGVPPPVESDTLTRLTEARVCDVAVAVLLKSLHRNEELIVEAAFIACGKVLPLLEEGRHVKLLDAMFKAARIPVRGHSRNNSSTAPKNEQFSVASSYSASAMNTSPSTLSPLHSTNSSHPRKPRWTVADNVGWRLRAALVQTFPAIVPVLSATLLVSHIVPAVLQMVGDPIAEVRNLASDALAVALGALWHFSQRPLPLPELTVAHVKRVSLRLNSNMVNNLANGNVNVEGNSTSTNPSVDLSNNGGGNSTSNAFLPSVDMATITLTANCLEDTIRQLTSLVETPSSDHPSNTTGTNIIPGSHNGRVAYATMCKAIFGIRDRHSIEIDGISTLNHETLMNDMDIYTTATRAEPVDIAHDDTAKLTRSQSSFPFGSSSSLAIPLLFDARTDPVHYLRQPCYVLAPVACAFIHAQGYIPQSYIEELLGGSHRSINNDYEDTSSSNNVHLPLWWKNITHSIYELYRIYGTDIPLTNGYSSLGSSMDHPYHHHHHPSSLNPVTAPSATSSLNSLPPQVRHAVLLAQPHAPKLRSAEQLRKAAGFLYDKYLKLPLLRLLRYYRPHTYWWNEIGPLAGSVALAVAEREWKPILAREAIDRHLTDRIRKQRWEEEELQKAKGLLPLNPVIQKHIRLRAWSGNVGSGNGGINTNGTSVIMNDTKPFVSNVNTNENGNNNDNYDNGKDDEPLFLSLVNRTEDLYNIDNRTEATNIDDGTNGIDNNRGLILGSTTTSGTLLSLSSLPDTTTDNVNTTMNSSSHPSSIPSFAGTGRSKSSSSNVRSWTIEAPITEVGTREKGGGGFR